MTHKAFTFLMAGHAHLDPVWLWDWREGYEALKATFRSALDRMAENPDMVFVHSSAAHYHWMEEHPALLAEIRAAVERGQWEPVGGWWVEPDMNIPSGESLARQGLYGQRYMEKALGRRATVAFLPDSFGHPGTIPQIFRQTGLTHFVFMRPGAHERELPSNLFWWEGADGTRVLTARVETYNTNPLNVAQSLGRNLAFRPQGEPEWIALYGVGNHGGGPTKALIQNIRDLNADPAWPSVQFSGLGPFFERAEQREHPVYNGSLQYHARGCYSVYSAIKQQNREAEETLLAAERWAAVASAFGRGYPVEPLTRAWRHLLFNQFHDLIGGTSIKNAYADAHHELGEAIGTGRRTLYGALQSITQQIDTTLKGRPYAEAYRRPRSGPGDWVTDMGDGVPVVVFNPSSWPRREVIDVEVADWTAPDLRVLDEEGNPVLHQNARTEAAVGERRRAVFTVEVPPLGYRTYRIIDEPPVAADDGGLAVTETSIENRWWRLELDPATGALRSLRDKERGLELLAGGGAQLLVVEDPTNPWGFREQQFRRLTGTFGEARFRVLESGPVRAVVAVTTRFGASTARQEFTLYRDVLEIHGRLRVNWQEQLKTLKLAFPFALGNAKATLSAPYGHLPAAGDGLEEPIQQWLDVTGELRDARGVAHPYGVALLNDSKYGADILGGEMRLSVLRSTVFASHRPDQLDPELGYPFTDQGWQEMRWALAPHAGPWQDAGVVHAAHAFNSPLPFVREYVHPGTLPPSQSFLTVTPPGAVVVTALKQAEQSDDLVLRLYEPHGRAAQAEVSLLGVRFAVEVRPQEIKSFRVSRSGRVTEVNMLEDPS